MCWDLGEWGTSFLKINAQVQHCHRDREGEDFYFFLSHYLARFWGA